jgi:ketosteroid isomerase-like protein
MTTDQTTAEQEIRDLHDAWFEASRMKDLSASMAPIAPDIVSYEHSTPLQYTDIEDIREECRKGFDYQSGDFKWTVPDLKIMVREDLAVAWGLNRMAIRSSNGTENVMWSRGTRVFQRTDGEWKMIHQHASFPMDIDTGAAATGLMP